MTWHLMFTPIMVAVAAQVMRAVCIELTGQVSGHMCEYHTLPLDPPRSPDILGFITGT